MSSASLVRENDMFGSTNSLAVTVKRDFQIIHENGLTMLACSQLIEQFNGFIGRVTVSNGAISVDGRSMIDMLQLAAIAGTVITIELSGRGADQVMKRIEPLFLN